MVLKEERRSELFNTLAWMGLLSTEERRIRSVREQDVDFYIDLDLTYDDIERVGYLYPHVAIHPNYKGYCELWFENTYLNPQDITWIDTDITVYAILNNHYDETIPVKCYYNPAIIYRYSQVAEDDETEYAHTITINITDVKYSDITNIERSAYYISQNKICIPEVIHLDENTVKFVAPYKHDIDFFICSNLANAVKVEAGKGTMIDQQYSTNCYHHMIVDNDPQYPLDCRFYPWITADKDCTVRIYKNSYHTILYPEVSRIINYPEFIDIEDPYTSGNEVLATMPEIDDIITSDNTEEEIIQKFANIAAYFYRMWEKFPIDVTEQSDFVVCDNTSLSEPTFSLQTINLYDEEIEKIISRVPFEENRDILFYNGVVFSDYTVRNLSYTSEGIYAENPNGMPTYLIDPSYDYKKFNLVKFNTAEDTQIMNIGEYIDVDNVAKLHYKLNKFYRNLLVIRQQLLNSKDEDYARIATVQPNTTDNYLWFELLTNAIPEMFSTNTIDAINLYGLDPKNIPEDVKEGAYMLELDPEGGPASYTDMLMTYFKLSRNKRQYLTLQYGEGIEDPRVQTFKNVKVGKLSENEKLNAMVIEDDSIDSTRTEEIVDYGHPEDPGTKNKEPGELYFQTHNYTSNPPPDEQNINIEEISLGPITPEGDEKTLWIDTDGQTPPGLIAKDSLDDVQEELYVVNDPDTLDVDKGAYAIDSNDDTFDLEGTISADEFDDMLEGLDESSEIDSSAPTEDLLGSIANALADNTTVDDIDDPEVGQIALDDITFMDEATGAAISMNDIAKYSKEEKLDIINKYITNDDEPDNAIIGDLWFKYQSVADENLLNTIVYKIILTKEVYNINQYEYGDLALEGEKLPENEESLAYGNFPKWVEPEQMLIQPMGSDEEGNVVPDYDMIREHNVKYIMSMDEPDTVEKSDLWLRMPAATLEEIIQDVISETLMEFGPKDLEEPNYRDDGHTTYASMGLDYDAHFKEENGVIGDLFTENKDDALHRIYFGDEINNADLKEDDIWYEFLDTIDDRVAYSDQNSMIIRMDERLILLYFSREDVQAFAFDDILINFRGKLGVKYLSIIADLINSGELSHKDINIFYKRLITEGDDLNPELRRLYTGESHVISMAKIDTTDYSVMYSSNIGRFTMDYSAPDVSNREREAAYRMCIDYSNRDFAFLHKRMLLFVNGKYIPRNEYKENHAGLIELINFKEIIATVDILYSKKDKMLMDLKRCSYKHWPVADTSKYIQRPSNYAVMEPVRVDEYTKKGYYDVLLDEYIFSGKLQRILNYLEEHKDEADEFRLDLIRKFHAISDVDISGIIDGTGRIIIPGNGSEDSPYKIQE